MSKLFCPLCNAADCRHYFQDKRRYYLQCRQCQLVFVNPDQRLSREQEKNEYDLHRNNGDDRGYRDFLSRLMSPLLKQLTTGMKGLDFGCGPGPVLAEMLRAEGFEMALYDYYYQAYPDRLEKRYDFITATEVFEHLFEPGKEIQRLWCLLNDSGCLAVMTKRVTDVSAFSRWHYKNDLTHVSFFSEETFVWLAGMLGAELQLIASDVVILKKIS